MDKAAIKEFSRYISKEIEPAIKDLDQWGQTQINGVRLRSMGSDSIEMTNHKNRVREQLLPKTGSENNCC